MHGISSPFYWLSTIILLWIFIFSQNNMEFCTPQCEWAAFLTFWSWNNLNESQTPGQHVSAQELKAALLTIISCRVEESWDINCSDAEISPKTSSGKAQTWCIRNKMNSSNSQLLSQITVFLPAQTRTDVRLHAIFGMLKFVNLLYSHIKLLCLYNFSFPCKSIKAHTLILTPAKPHSKQ